MENHKSTEDGKKPSSFRMTFYILLPFAIYFVVHDVVQMILSIGLDVSLTQLGDAYRQGVLQHASTVSAAISAVSMLIGLAFIWKMAKEEFAYASREEHNFGALPLERKLTFLGIVGGLAFCGALGINILFQLTGFTTSSANYQAVSDHQYGVAFWLGILLYGIISPLVEEIVFRGLIFNRMKRFFPLWIAMIASSVFFGLYHGNLVQGVYGTLLGLLLVCVYEMVHSFTAPFLFHAVANISVYTISYVTGTYQKICTIPNCVIFMTMAVILFVLLWKVTNRRFYSREGI